MVKMISTFSCDICQKTHTTKSHATQCENKCKKKEIAALEKKNQLETQYNYPRLNATSIDEYVAFVNIELKKMFPKITEILVVNNVRVVHWSRSASSKQVEPTDTGIELSVDVRVKYLRVNGWTEESNILKRFGIHTHSGGGGNSIMHYPGSTIYLDDLPKIKDIFKKNNEIRNGLNAQIIKLNDKFMTQIDNDRNIKNYDKIIEELNHQIKQTVYAKQTYIDITYVISMQNEYSDIIAGEEHLGCVGVAQTVALIKSNHLLGNT